MVPELTESEVRSLEQGGMIPCAAFFAADSLTKQLQGQLLEVLTVVCYVLQSLGQVMDDSQYT